MYKVFVMLGLFVFLTSCEPKVLPTVVDVRPEEVIVKFSHMSDMGEMANAAMSCAQQNINMQYAGTEFFEDGRLRKLALQVTLPNGQKGTTSADLSTLQFKYYGFTINKEGNFKIGHLD